MAVSIVSNSPFQTATAITSGQVVIPSGSMPAVVAGDIYLVHTTWISLTGNAPADVDYPAGWTRLTDAVTTSAGRRNFSVAYIDASQANGVTVQASNATESVVAINVMVIRGADLSNPIVGKTSILTNTTGSPSGSFGGANGILASVPGSAAIWCASWWNSNTTATLTWTGATKSQQNRSGAATSSGQYAYQSNAIEQITGLQGTATSASIGAAIGDPSMQGFVFRPAGSTEPLLSAVGTTSATSPDSVTTQIVVPLPSGMQAGDYMVLGYTISSDADSGAVVNPNTPSGWSSIDSSLGNAKTRAVVWGKFWDGSETSVTITHASVDCGEIAIVSAYRGTDPGNPVSQFTRYNAGVTGAVVIPSITPTGPNNMLHLFTAEYMDATITHTYSQGVETADLCIDAGGIGTAEELAASAGMLPVATTSPTGSITITPSAAGTAGMRYGIAVALQPLQNATVVADDTGAATDDAKVTASIPDSDNGTVSNETASLTIQDSISETATAADTAAVQAIIPATQEDAAGTDSAAVAATVPDADAATMTDDAYVSNTVLAQETVSGTDDAGSVLVSDSDTSTSTDDATLSAQVPVSEDVAATDDSTIRQYDSDTGAATDDTLVALPVSDSVTMPGESASLDAKSPASDTFAGTDDASVLVTAATDVFDPVSDNAIRSISGLLVGPRVKTIEPENRIMVVARESRTIVVATEVRVIRILKETSESSQQMRIYRREDLTV